MTEKCWCFAFVAQGWSIEAAFHYNDYGSYKSCLAEAEEQFLLKFNGEAKFGYAVFLSALSCKDKDLRYMFSVDFKGARRKVQRELKRLEKNFQKGFVNK